MSDAIREWLDGLRRLDAYATAVPGLSNKTWPEVLSYAIDFVRTRGDEAHEAGWGTLQLFGVHPGAGAMRADCTGALIQYRPVTIVSIAPKLIVFSNGLKDRGSFNPVESIPIWTFRAPGRNASKT